MTFSSIRPAWVSPTGGDMERKATFRSMARTLCIISTPYLKWKYLRWYRYRNWNYDLLGKIIEKATGVSYEQFIEDRILAPLGMNHSITRLPSSSSAGLATLYASLNDRTAFEFEQPKIWDRSAFSRAQCILTPANELLKYGKGSIQAYYMDEGDQIKEDTHAKSPLKLSREQLGCHIIRSNNCQPGRRYGHGTTYIMLPATLGFGYNGNCLSMAGYTTTFVLIPDDGIAIPVVTNSIGLADPIDRNVTAVLEAILASLENHDVVESAKAAAALLVHRRCRRHWMLT
ncbi:beta-lactamase/transpeptidase-like protein [Triangularia verruculosa]|uniref:Beta-lactamase/transpeptidase-like protein n=1 Tax=Triangularia verruculosa TaxID=2587418 RepID=A0AAN6XIM6_9PEZI|nr:beta-lactamase/transpeptidase-like protein [Triangularia verruculosa]